MRIHYLVEGPSEEELLKAWLPRALPQHRHVVYPHEGKGSLPRDLLAPPEQLHRGLLHQLPAKLRAYGQVLDPATDCVVVLVDADNDEPANLRAELEAVLASCTPRPPTAIRVAVEETEAFYLGDLAAIKLAFRTFKGGPYGRYVQDSVCGTWEVFQAVVGWKYEAKVKWARAIAPHLSTATNGPALNRSPSFVDFYSGLKVVAGEQWP